MEARTMREAALPGSLVPTIQLSHQSAPILDSISSITYHQIKQVPLPGIPLKKHSNPLHHHHVNQSTGITNDSDNLGELMVGSGDGVMAVRDTSRVARKSPLTSTKRSYKDELSTPISSSPIRKGASSKRQHKRAQDDCGLAPGEEWKCVECGVREHETPLKRKGPDKKRNLCNACYVRWRVRAERAERGSARPVMSESGGYFTQNGSGVRSFTPQHSQAKIEIAASPLTSRYTGSGSMTPYSFGTGNGVEAGPLSSRSSSFLLGRQSSMSSLSTLQNSQMNSMADVFGVGLLGNYGYQTQDPLQGFPSNPVGVLPEDEFVTFGGGGMGDSTDLASLMQNTSTLSSASAYGFNPLSGLAGTQYGYIDTPSLANQESYLTLFDDGINGYQLPASVSGEFHDDRYGLYDGAAIQETPDALDVSTLDTNLFFVSPAYL
ncbi:hypothetical protein HDU67_007879 [Dinochytrium kinnereticum]|nr:hypothetical protein HDU67_007879 [Dinochytrium kinnereticum]